LNQPTSTFPQIELYISIRNLIDVDTFSKTDPFIRGWIS